MVYPITTRLLVDDVEVYAGGPDSWDGQPTVLEGLTISWGRETIIDQPDAGTAGFTVHQQITGDPDQISLFETLHVGSVVQVRSTAPSSGREVTVWAGEITAATVQQDGDYAITAAVSCIDPSAVLSNITVGDEPWPQQTAYERFQAILAAAGLRIHGLRQTTETTGWIWALTGDLDSSLQTIEVAARDVDAQPPLALIQDLATSIGGVAWVTADDQGPYIWIEDPTQRDGLKQFVIDPATGVVTITDAAIALVDNPDLWAAADIVREPVTWTQDPSQVVTVIELTWLQPGIDDSGQPTTSEQTVTATDPDRVAEYNIRKLSLNTDLISEIDAAMLAFNLLAQSATAAWILSGLSIDTAVLTRPLDGIDDAERIDKIMDLLDIRERIGRRLSVQQLPAWSMAGPVQSYYLEGGGSFSWQDGRWTLELTASANAIGGGATWEEIPAEVTWEDVDESISWFDAYGVAAPEPTGGP